MSQKSKRPHKASVVERANALKQWLAWMNLPAPKGAFLIESANYRYKR